MPASAAVAACRDFFVNRVLVAAARDAEMLTFDLDPTVVTPDEVLGGAIGWLLNKHAPRFFATQLAPSDAAAMTRVLRAVAGAPADGCCGGMDRFRGCRGCEVMEDTRADSPAVLFDTALAVLGGRW
jgi:hypothetical protein